MRNLEHNSEYIAARTNVTREVAFLLSTTLGYMESGREMRADTIFKDVDGAAILYSTELADNPICTNCRKNIDVR